MSEHRADGHSAQVVSKRRVADYGEVYTSEREVNAMLDLVKRETGRIDSRFLEPACGTGNFLVEVLRRKLAAAQKRSPKSRFDYECSAANAAASVYGVDILLDNVLKCRNRLFDCVAAAYRDAFGLHPSDDYCKSIRYIFERNIIWGDALTLRTADETPNPILFSEWSLLANGMVKRRDFAFADMLSYTKREDEPLFSDEGGAVLIPKPVADYPLAHYLRLHDAY